MGLFVNQAAADTAMTNLNTALANLTADTDFKKTILKFQYKDSADQVLIDSITVTGGRRRRRHKKSVRKVKMGRRRKSYKKMF